MSHGTGQATAGQVFKRNEAGKRFVRVIRLCFTFGPVAAITILGTLLSFVNVTDWYRLLTFAFFAASTIAIELCLHGVHILNERIAALGKQLELTHSLVALPAELLEDMNLNPHGEFYFIRDQQLRLLAHRAVYLVVFAFSGLVWLPVAGCEIIHMGHNQSFGLSERVIWIIERGHIMDAFGIICATITIFLAVWKIWKFAAQDEAKCAFCKSMCQYGRSRLVGDTPESVSHISGKDGSHAS